MVPYTKRVKDHPLDFTDAKMAERGSRLKWCTAAATKNGILMIGMLDVITLTPHD